MSIIRDYIKSKLITPMKKYPTKIQDTMIELIIDRIEELYDLTVKFPEILSPDQTRLDIINVIADQFCFDIRDEADMREQLGILESILYLYRKRGSIDTIEHLWKYYGGDLPKELKVNIPAYNLFRYSVSNFSGTDRFQDGDIYRSGVYEIILTNNTYPIPTLKDFLLKELVAAGNRIYFTNNLASLLYGEDASYEYLVHEHTFVDIKMRNTNFSSGMTWSGPGALNRKSELSLWSGRAELFVELTKLLEMDTIQISDYIPRDFYIEPHMAEVVTYLIENYKNLFTSLELSTHYTEPLEDPLFVKYSYDKEGTLLDSEYPGYFVISHTLLGSEV